MNSLKIYHEAIDAAAPVVPPKDDSLEAVRDAAREYNDRRKAFENYFIGALSVLIMDLEGGDKVWMEAIASAVQSFNKETLYLPLSKFKVSPPYPASKHRRGAAGGQTFSKPQNNPEETLRCNYPLPQNQS